MTFFKLIYIYPEGEKKSVTKQFLIYKRIKVYSGQLCETDEHEVSTGKTQRRRG
jgi:hypothetical protein